MRQSAITWKSEMAEDDLSLLLDNLEIADFSGSHLEIGTAAGGTLVELGKFYQEKKKKVKFLVVDPMSYFDNQLEIVKANLDKNNIDPKSVEFLVGTSKQVFDSSVRRDLNLDFILVDGSHKCRHVMKDLKWIQHLNINGIIAFDDYQSGFDGVDWVVDNFLKRHPGFEVIAQGQRLLLVKKVKARVGPMVSVFDLLVAEALNPFFQLKKSIMKRLSRLS